MLIAFGYNFSAKSKAIIDEIDCIFAECFGFSLVSSDFPYKGSQRAR
jgi:hypothetical protein